MVVSFPHIGSLSVALESFLGEVGVKVIVPPPVSKATLDIGVRYSPETVCLPFKFMLGTYVQSLEAGADTLLTCGGSGPCRLGLYSPVHQNILRDLGYRFTMVTVEPGIAGLWQAFRSIVPLRRWASFTTAYRLAEAKLFALDETEGLARWLRPREQWQGAADKLHEYGVELIRSAAHSKEVRAVVQNLRKMGMAWAADSGEQPIRIGLAGEFYLTSEPYANRRLISRLGRLGVEVEPVLTLGDYLRRHRLAGTAARREERTLLQAAYPYLGHTVGGHGMESVGAAAMSSNFDWEGLIHVRPFTCMPEVIACHVMPEALRNSGVPLLALAFDEQTAEEGIGTRVEAFVELLRMRRREMSEMGARNG